MRSIKLNQADISIYSREIEPYLPEKIFDAHSHTYINEFYTDLNERLPLSKHPLLNNVDFNWLEQWWLSLFPNKKVNGLVLGTPAKGCRINEINQHLSQDIRSPNRFSILVHPQTSSDELDKQIRQLKPSGLKPYMCFTALEDFQQARITDMITEEQLDVANRHNLCVTLHVAKPHGMADKQNLNDIKQLVRDYPKCNFILAHCGRCFLSCFMEEALDQLPVAENLWIDTSAVCDVGVFIHLLTKYDRSRILFGTDLVNAAGYRGKYITMGLRWGVCEETAFTTDAGTEKSITFAAYENLRALIQAVRFCKLKDKEIQNLFYDNSSFIVRNC